MKYEKKKNRLHGSDSNRAFIKIENRPEDFTHDKEWAKKWTAEHRAILEKELTKPQIEALRRLHERNEHDINKVLKDTGGDIDSLPREENNGNPDEKLLECIKYYKEDREKSFEGFTRRSSKLAKKLFAYKQMSAKDLGYNIEAFWDNQEQFNRELGDKLIESLYQFGLRSDFMEVTASHDPVIDKNQFIRLRLELPTGTPIIPVGNQINNTLYIPSDYGFIVKGMRLSAEKGKEILNIEANCIGGEDKDLITQHINGLKNSMNELWTNTLGFPKDKSIFDFRFADTFASGVLARAHNAIQDTIINENVSLNVNDVFLLQVTKYLIDGNGSVIFTDKGLGYLPELQLGKILSEEKMSEYNLDLGETNHSTRCIGINCIKDYEGIKDTLIHELTHLQDRYLGRRILQKDINFTEINDIENGYFQ
jgi:hypothetical protein